MPQLCHLDLVAEKENPLDIQDFWPISLIHSFSKIFSKILTSRLTTLLPQLISPAQSAFVQTRSIHENFKLVANIAKSLHMKKKSAILMKIDISKAFDTLSWEFLIEILRHRGFGNRWCSWTCGLLASAQTSIMINGEKGAPIQLVRGVRQGDPLSPALFMLTMDALHATLQWAVNHSLLSDLGLNCSIPRVSIYADDAVLFFRPMSSDLAVISEILGLFADSSGLRINLQKSSVTPISCDNDSSQTVANYFQCLRKEFPITAGCDAAL